MRAVIFVALVIKLSGGLMGNVHFLRMCWDKYRFLEVLPEAGQRWQRIQSQNRDRVRRGEGSAKTHFAKAEEITFRDIWGSPQNTQS